MREGGYTPNIPPGHNIKDIYNIYIIYYINRHFRNFYISNILPYDMKKIFKRAVII